MSSLVIVEQLTLDLFTASYKVHNNTAITNLFI